MKIWGGKQVGQIIEKQNLYTLIINKLIESILSDEIVVGEKLISETELAAIYGVSRNMLREALKTLEIFGVIESRHGSGTYVSEYAKQRIPNIAFAKALSKNQSVISLLEVRMVIESGLAALAAKKRTDDDIELMLQNVDSTYDYDRDSLTDLYSRSFHMTIAHASHCDILVKYLESIYQQLSYSEYSILKSKISNEYFAKDLVEHHQILDSIIAQDSGNAQRLSYLHLYNRLNLILQLNDME